MIHWVYRQGATKLKQNKSRSFIYAGDRSGVSTVNRKLTTMNEVYIDNDAIVFFEFVLLHFN